MPTPSNFQNRQREFKSNPPNFVAVLINFLKVFVQQISIYRIENITFKFTASWEQDLGLHLKKHFKDCIDYWVDKITLTLNLYFINSSITSGVKCAKFIMLHLHFTATPGPLFESSQCYTAPPTPLSLSEQCLMSFLQKLSKC